MAKELFKSSAATTLSITGHTVKPNPADKTHGYKVEATAKTWAYTLKDKTETKTNSQNMVAWYF